MDLHEAEAPRRPELDTASLRRIDLLREQLRMQNRRAAGPFSHPLATNGPLRKLRDHICDLSRLADAALLNAETADPSRFPVLAKDLRMLLQTQQTWTGRLENQIWRLESQLRWQLRLDEILSTSGVQRPEITAFCESFAGETRQIPSGSLLLPEPGLPFSPCSRLSTVPGDLLSVEHLRTMIYFTTVLLSDSQSPDGGRMMIEELVLQMLNSLHNPVADDVSVSSCIDRAIKASKRALSNEELHMMTAAIRVIDAIEKASLDAVDYLIPPAITDFYSRACAGLASAHGQSEPVREMTMRIMNSLCLNLPEHQIPVEATGTSVVLTHKLRWHDAESAAVGNGGTFRPRGTHFRCGETTFSVVSET